MLHLLDPYLRKYPLWRKWRGLPEPMSVTLAQITENALRIFNEHNEFISRTVNSAYSTPFAAGGTLKLRQPQQYCHKADKP